MKKFSAETGGLPSRAYQVGVTRGDWQDDAAQRAVLSDLDRIFVQVCSSNKNALWRAVRVWLGVSKPVLGLYLWGSVGRGKTFLMDLLYECLPHRVCMRIHFHRFMGHVHAELHALRGTRDPLKVIAKQFAERSRVLCLDEFFVQDIGDAMILSELLRHLFAQGVCLITSSNMPPQDLYKDGLQHAKFRPAIALLKKHCKVHELISPVDYRLRALQQAPVFYHPHDDQAQSTLHACFRRLSPGSPRSSKQLLINDRSINVIQRAEGVVWFNFVDICEGPRSVADYIEVARSYNTVVISKVPSFTRSNEDAAKRFIHMVDEFYDRNIKLIMSAAAAITELYQGNRHKAEFDRTASRLIEMQSEAYLAKEHKP